jgi:DNA (cytosine-5)-methyltransferase 1
MEVKLKVLELFAGIGGFSVGLERTGGFETAAFCEIDKHARKVLQKNWPSVPIYEDVREITIERLKADGNVPDVITGGFPCQDISTAGLGAGLAGERSGLWFEFARIIKEVRPRWVIAENVSVLRSRGLDQVLRSLSEIGYDAEWHCIPASSVGAPHQRDRIWIMAYPKSFGGQRVTGEFQTEDEQQKTKRSEEWVWEPINASSGNGEALAYSTSSGCESLHDRDTKTRNVESSSEIMADSNGPQCQGGSLPSRILTEDTDLGSGSWWEVEPSVGRVADGFPGRTHRLKQLGNAVVPQIPEIIGRAILERIKNG